MKHLPVFGISLSLLVFAGCGNQIDSTTHIITEASTTPPTENMEEFKQKFLDFSVKANEVYELSPEQLADGNETWNQDSNSLNMEIGYDFQLITDTAKFAIQNNLTQFINPTDAALGWAGGNAAFWAPLSNKTKDSSQFTVLRDKEMNKMGDQSEYSELRMGTYLSVIYHVRIKNVILHYMYVIDPKQKDQLLGKISDRVRKIEASL
jgi:hypothetical protein